MAIAKSGKRRGHRGMVDAKAVRKRATERKSAGGYGYLDLPEGIDKWTPEKGINLIDVIPYEVTVNEHPEGIKKGGFWYRRLFYIHRGIGVDEVAVICPRKTLGKRCPICEEWDAMRQDENVGDKEADALRPKERELFNVYDRKNKSAGIQIFDYSTFLFGKRLEKEVRESDDPNVHAFSCVIGGRTLKVRFTSESGGGNTFLAADRIDFVKRSAELKESIVDKTVDLDTCLKVLSYKELKALLHEGMAAEEDDEDEDDSKSKKSKSKKSKVKEEDVDEEEEEEEEDSDEDEDEEEEEEDSDGDEDEEEEEEDSDGDEEEEDEEEEEEDEEEEEEEEEEEDEDEEEEPQTKKVKGKAKRK